MSAVSVLALTFNRCSRLFLRGVQILSKQARMDDRVSIDDGLYLALGTGAIDEEEFSLIMLALDSDEEEATEPLGPRLNVKSLATRRCKDLFRFTQKTAGQAGLWAET